MQPTMILYNNYVGHDFFFKKNVLNTWSVAADYWLYENEHEKHIGFWLIVPQCHKVLLNSDSWESVKEDGGGRYVRNEGVSLEW